MHINQNYLRFMSITIRYQKILFIVVIIAGLVTFFLPFNNITHKKYVSNLRLQLQLSSKANVLFNKEDNEKYLLDEYKKFRDCEQYQEIFYTQLYYPNKFLDLKNQIILSRVQDHGTIVVNVIADNSEEAELLLKTEIDIINQYIKKELFEKSKLKEVKIDEITYTLTWDRSAIETKSVNPIVKSNNGRIFWAGLTGIEAGLIFLLYLSKNKKGI